MPGDEEEAANPQAAPVTSAVAATPHKPDDAPADAPAEEATDSHASAATHIRFDPSAYRHSKDDETLYIPGPRDRDQGHALVEMSKKPPALESDGNTVHPLQRPWSLLPAAEMD